MMTGAAKFVQVASLPEEVLKPLAVLLETPDDLTRMYDLRFTEEPEPGLGRLRWASTTYGDEPFVFEQYPDSHEPGVTLWGRSLPEDMLDDLDLIDWWRLDDEAIEEASLASSTTSTPATEDGAQTHVFYWDDGALYRAADYMTEVLNGDRWEFLPVNVMTSTMLTHEEAAARASGADIQAPNAGVSAALDVPEEAYDGSVDES